MDFKAKKKNPSQIDVERHQIIRKEMTHQEDTVITTSYILIPYRASSKGGIFWI